MNKKRRELLMALAGVPPLAALGTQPLPLDDQFDQLIADFGRLRTIAYEQVLDLKALNKNSQEKLNYAENAYKKAKITSDAWLDTAQASITTAQGRPDAKVLKKITSDLHSRINELITIANAERRNLSPNEATRNAALVAAVAAFITSISGLLEIIYESVNSADEKERTSIRNELKNLRWASFSEI